MVLTYFPRDRSPELIVKSLYKDSFRVTIGWHFSPASVQKWNNPAFSSMEFSRDAHLLIKCCTPLLTPPIHWRLVWKRFRAVVPGFWNLLHKYIFRIKEDYIPILQVWSLVSKRHFPPVSMWMSPRSLTEILFSRKEKLAHRNFKCPGEVFLDICSSRSKCFSSWSENCQAQTIHNVSTGPSQEPSLFLFLQSTEPGWKSYLCFGQSTLAHLFNQE